MLNENVIACDMLANEKHTIEDLTTAILETKNQNLKQILIQMRDQAQQAQEEIFNIAEQNNWYLPAENADPQHISNFHDFFNQNFIHQSQQQTQNQQNQTIYQRGQQTGQTQRQQVSSPQSISQGNQQNYRNNQRYGNQTNSNNKENQPQKQPQYGYYDNR